MKPQKNHKRTIMSYMNITKRILNNEYDFFLLTFVFKLLKYLFDY